MRFFLIAGLLGGLVCPLLAEELTVHMQYLDSPSPFEPQLWVQVTNEGFTSTPLQDKIKTSELLVDGHPFTRTDVPFAGPEGLPVKGSWEGCMALESYLPDGLSPGRHHLQFRLGDNISQDISVKMRKTETAATTPEKAQRQVNAMKDVISDGLLRSCVENWLKERDGGLSTIGATRYYVDPGVKVLVSYAPSQPEPRVKGRIRSYKESRLQD